jgi:hypothetical protein
MKKCKTAMEDPQSSICGKDICCCFCPDRDTCKNACDGDETCEDIVDEPDALQVIETALPDKIAQLSDLMVAVKKAEAQIDKIKTSLLKAMEENNVKSFKNDIIEVTYVGPSTRSTFDKKALEADHPELDLTKYNKTSAVKSSVRIKVK